MADVDAKLLKLIRIEQAVAVIAHAADEGAPPAELRERNDRIGHRAAAHQRRFVLPEALQQVLLCGKIDEHHAAALESEGAELRFGDLQKDVEESVPQATK